MNLAHLFLIAVTLTVASRTDGFVSPKGFVTPKLLDKITFQSTPQSFFNLWVRNYSSAIQPKTHTETQAETLTQTQIIENKIERELDSWLLRSSILVSPDQEKIIERMPDRPVLISLKAWVYLRHGLNGEEVLKKLPANNKLKPLLADTVAMAHAKRGEINAALQTYQNHLKPFLEINHDAVGLSQFYLKVARLYYQAGQFDLAQSFYERVPTGATQYLKAREERIWTLLKRNDLSHLRGELKTLTSPLFDGHFAPEIYLVRAVANLLFCFYEDLETDFHNFTVSNNRWAVLIDSALRASIPPFPFEPDLFTKLAQKAVEKLNEEQKKSPLDLSKEISLAQTQLRKEILRQWRNQKIILGEAIRKMRFVKLEYMSQMKQLSLKKSIKPDLVASGGTIVPSRPFQLKKDQIIFPLEEQIWADEYFKMHAAAQAICRTTR